MTEVYTFTPKEFGAAFSLVRPRCQCRVCVGVRRWAGNVSQTHDPADKERPGACERNREHVIQKATHEVPK